VVLDDAVVHDGEAAGNVRMSVALGGRAVRRPARVGDAGLSGDMAGGRLRGKLGNAPGRAHALERSAVHHGDARRVVAPVFEAPQAFHQHRDDVPARRAGDDAAHRLSPSSSAASSPESTPGVRVRR
jgi:hypothetical protein